MLKDNEAGMDRRGIHQLTLVSIEESRERLAAEREERAAREIVRIRAHEEAQIIGAECEARYNQRVERFRSLFAIAAPNNNEESVTATHPIVLDRILDKELGIVETVAIVRTLDSQESYRVRHGRFVPGGYERVPNETAPDYKQAENFVIEFWIRGDEKPRHVERFAAKRRPQPDETHPYIYLWPNEGEEWQTENAHKLKAILDGILPQIDDSIDLLISPAMMGGLRPDPAWDVTKKEPL